MKDKIILLIFLLILVAVNGKVLNYTAVGCRVATNGEFPHQVSIHMAYGDFEFVCGGTMVSENMVLTTAHTMYYRWGGVLPPIIVTVFAGRSDLRDSPSQEFAVKKITFHPGFETMQMIYNIALLEVTLFSKNAATLSLHDPTAQNQTQNQCEVIGWNLNSNDLNVYQVDIIKCTGIFETEICTQNKISGENLSQLSPGSGLFCNKSLIGILSVPPEVNSTAIFESLWFSKEWLYGYGVTSRSSNSFIFLFPSSIMLFCVIIFSFVNKLFIY